MPSVVAQIAPQRSTQYADIAKLLAPHELSLSPLGRYISSMQATVLGGQSYLQFDLDTDVDAELIREFGMLAMTTAFFAYYEQIGDQVGPFLRPLEPSFTPALPSELVTTRRYRGKTNELFTHFLCNLARYSSGLVGRPWQTLRLFDPLAGGGTTLFTGLMLGANVAGVEQNAKDVQSTVTFLRQYAQQRRISHQVQEERLKKIGRRWSFYIGKKRSSQPQQQCILAQGDTLQSPTLLSGFKPHLLVTDLPYGIQHHGQLVTLLTHALPVWASLLRPSGAIVFAWESTRFSREKMIALVESTGPFRVLNEPPYNQLTHRVDRVIKQRDVLVVRFAG